MTVEFLRVVALPVERAAVVLVGGLHSDAVVLVGGKRPPGRCSVTLWCNETIPRLGAAGAGCDGELSRTDDRVISGR